jgi:DedD protein
MGLLSIFRKNKQESAPDDGEFFTRSEDESNAVRGRVKRKSRKQGNEPVDPALPEKKRARRRLVGAIALVLAAVIALPMILDSEPKPLASDIAIQIPAKDSPPVRSENTRATPTPPIATSGVPVAAGLDKDEEIVSAPSAPTPLQKNTATSPPPADRSATSEASSKPASMVGDKLAVQSPPSRKPDNPDRAKAILEGRAPAKADAVAGPGDRKSGAYLVQVAALSSQHKVVELQGKLKSAGIKSHTQKVATANGDRIRVRVGPFASRDEADKMREKIGKLGLNGTLVPA